MRSKLERIHSESALPSEVPPKAADQVSAALIMPLYQQILNQT